MKNLTHLDREGRVRMVDVSEKPLTTRRATAEATGCTGPVTFEWDFGDGNTSTEPYPTHIYTDPGSYTVTLISYGDCADTLTRVDYGGDGTVKER